MNARPERAAAREREPVRRRLARLVEPVVSRQSLRDKRRLPTDEPGARDDASVGGAGCVGEGLRGDLPSSADPLEDPDPGRAADAAGVENLLRCWVRETGLGDHPGHGAEAMGSPAATSPSELLVPLPASGLHLRVPVRYWSATGHHRFGPVSLDTAPQEAPPLSAVALAALLSRESAVEESGGAGDGAGTPSDADGTPLSSTAPRSSDPSEAMEAVPPPREGDAFLDPAPDAMTEPADVWESARVRPDAPTPSEIASASLTPDTSDAALVGRVADSVQRTTVFLAARRAHPAPGAQPADRFLRSEQDLLFGHPLHPTPKSREGLAGGEARRCSPELRGSFPLHWIAVHTSLFASGSQWQDGDAPVTPAAELLSRAAVRVPDGPAGTVPLPLHPWQARDLLHRPQVGQLVADGLLHDLGEQGDRWYPTSSVRTVHRPGSRHMLKLSLGLRITNSRRENLRKELLRGLEVHRLLVGGLAEQWRAAQLPGAGFDVLRDRAWAGVNDCAGDPLPGFDTVIRDNPFASSDDVLCVAALTAMRPAPGTDLEDAPGTDPEDEEDQSLALTSRLREAVTRIATASGRRTDAVSAEWFLRYLETVVRPVLWLDAVGGVALESHQQNTLVRLDAEGWPDGGWYRDNQGFYFRERHRDRLTERLPGVGIESDTFVSDDVADERLLYYLGINNVLGLIGGFGAQRLADESLLLDVLRGFLEGQARADEGRPASGFATRLLEAPTLRCKANLLTRLRGLDELVGPVDGQSVYVTFRNPLALG